MSNDIKHNAEGFRLGDRVQLVDKESRRRYD